MRDLKVAPLSSKLWLVVPHHLIANRGIDAVLRLLFGKVLGNGLSSFGLIICHAGFGCTVSQFEENRTASAHCYCSSIGRWHPYWDGTPQSRLAFTCDALSR